MKTPDHVRQKMREYQATRSAMMKEKLEEARKQAALREAERLEKEERKKGYEDNILVEPILQWKTLTVHEGKLVSPRRHDFIWTPMEAVKADCHHEMITEECSCGIYGANDITFARTYGDIECRISMWGRFIRGNAGCRAEFAYPQSFYITDEQVEHLPLLMEFHVPIYQLQPTLVYDPKEDGYEYWRNEEDGHGDPSEESSTDEDYETGQA